MGCRKRENQKEQKKSKWSLDTVSTLISVGVTIFPIQQYIAKKEIPQVGFNVLMIFLLLRIVHAFGLALHIYLEKEKQYRENLEVLDKYAETKKKARVEYAYWEKNFQKEYKDDLKKNILMKVKISFGSFVIIVIICMFFPENAHSFWNGVLGVEDVEQSSTSPADERVAEPTEEPIQEKRDMTWRFVLDKPVYSFTLDTQVEDQVYFYSAEEFTEHAEWEAYVQETSRQWKEEQKEGVDYKNVKNNEGKCFYDYTNSEDMFKEKVDYSSKYIYFDEWMEHAPHSGEYDACIIGRENLCQADLEGKKGHYEIWWKLANDYQYYAQEYERQTENVNAILFYYTKSIYCCMEALKYSISEAEYNRTYHFMIMRYHDICRDECIISQKYKIRANAVYSILSKTDPLGGVE